MNFSSSENLIDSTEANIGDDQFSFHDPSDKPLSEIEKTFLLHAERGDCATVKRIIQEYREFAEEFDINCEDALSRSALVSAIENENMDLIKLLLSEGIAVKDSLLYAIKEEYVEAVEVLLVHEEKFHKPGEPYSWEKVDRSSSNFTPDMTPLILAAHKNNFEILKLLLDRGASLPVPHDVRCACDDCVNAYNADSLQHSKSRMNAYKALTSPSLIALSSTDPILTAFELSWDLKRLSKMETEFRAEYNEMRSKVQNFAVSLLDHVRSSFELEVLLNHDPEGMTWDPGEHQSLERLKLAIKYKQKNFVAHPNVQQLLASIWYEGLPGFKKKNLMNQLFEVVKIGAMFPVYCTMYLFLPLSKMGVFMKKPFVKFICHSSSYSLFLMLLGAASQRIEILFLEQFGNKWMRDIAHEWKTKERGTWPGLAECGVIIYVLSLIWAEITALWKDGLTEYIADLWNILDFITNFFYVIWLVLRISACYITYREEKEGLNPWYPREQWDIFEPMLISEGAFAAGMIFSFLKLVHIFSINPHLGPLQISLGRMIIDIIKFFFIYNLVLFAFGCGLNQLLWYYAELEKEQCFHLPSGLPDFENHDKECTIWRRYSNLFETSQSLFWASFGLVDLVSFDLTGIKGFTRFWALLMFGSYSVINVIVLLNMLIAMMSNSYQIISERADVEWKFARSRLWISYFDDGDTLPPPFNIIPKPKSLFRTTKCTTRTKSKSFIEKSRENSKQRYNYVIKLLVRRYVTAEQRNRDDFSISEDDVMEIRQDISSLRYELVEILRQNGMTTPRISEDEVYLIGKKNKLMERRILKDFQIGLAGGIGDKMETFGKDTKDVFSQLVEAIAKKASKKKSKDWNELARKRSLKSNPIGSIEEVETAQKHRQSMRKKMVSNSRQESVEVEERKRNKFPPLSRVIKLGRMERAQQLATMAKEEDSIQATTIKEETEHNSANTANEKKNQETSPPIEKEPVKISSPIKQASPKKSSLIKHEPATKNSSPIKSPPIKTEENTIKKEEKVVEPPPEKPPKKYANRGKWL